MKKNILTILLVLIIVVATAQTPVPIVPVLEQIEQNNRLLQAAREEMKAEILDVKSENNLPNPEVNYAHLFNSERGSQQQSELTVVQGFDFPTTYIVRSKYNQVQTDVFKRRYEIMRRDILLEAKLLCVELIGLNREACLLNMLAVHADSLSERCDRRLVSGDATILEANRAKLDLMGIRTELAENAAAHRKALQRLLAMNGNLYIENLVEEEYPVVVLASSYEALCDEVMPLRRDLLEAQAEHDASQQQVAVSKQGWLPKLQLGYRRNTAPMEEFNGFVVGGSIPLFENRNRVKAAKARHLSSELRKEELELQVEASLQTLYNEACQVKESMDAYDLPLMDEAFLLLNQALDGGELSWHEYFVEMEIVARRKLEYLKLENRYQKLIAEIYADRL